MANNEAQIRRNQQIKNDHPHLAHMIDEREEDREQLATYTQAKKLGMSGYELIHPPDMTERRKLALEYLNEANNSIIDLVNAVAPKPSELLKPILQLRGVEGTAMSTVQKEKAAQIGTILDTNYKIFHDLEKKIGDAALRTGSGRDELIRIKSNYFDPVTGEVVDTQGFGLALNNLLSTVQNPDDQAATLAWLSGQTTISVPDLKGIALAGVGPTSQEFQDLQTSFNDVELNANNLATQRLNAKRETELQWKALNGIYGGLTGPGRDLIASLERALLSLDDEALGQALGITGIKDLPETEASKEMRKIISDLMKPQDGVDYWMQDSEHVEGILSSPEFEGAAAEMQYTGRGIDVLGRITQQYEGESGVEQRADAINEAYRIFELDQPPGTPLNWLRAATTVMFNRDAYNQLKASRQGISPQQAAQDTRADTPQTEADLKDELLRVDAETKAAEGAEGAPTTPEAPQAPIEGAPSPGTIAAMQRMADSQGSPLPIGQTGLFVQPGQGGQLFTGAEDGAGELVPYTPPVAEAAPEEAAVEAAVEAPGEVAPEGEVRMGTDGWADYKLSPDGTIRYTRKGETREVTVTPDHPGAYYSIREKVFGEEIPPRFKPSVMAARARQETPAVPDDGAEADLDFSGLDVPEEPEGVEEEGETPFRAGQRISLNESMTNALKRQRKRLADGDITREEYDRFVSSPPGNWSEEKKDFWNELSQPYILPPVSQEPVEGVEETKAPYLKEDVPAPYETEPYEMPRLSAPEGEGTGADVLGDEGFTRMVNDQLLAESQQPSEMTERLLRGEGVNRAAEEKAERRAEGTAPPPEPPTSEPAADLRTSEEEPPEEEPETSEQPKQPTLEEQEPYTDRPGKSLQPPDAPEETPEPPPGRSIRASPTAFESLSLPPSKSASVAADTGLSQASVGTPSKQKSRGAKAAKEIAAVLASAKEKEEPKEDPRPGQSVVGGP